jgi:DNA-binding XRE family transcriptional regulator
MIKTTNLNLKALRVKAGISQADIAKRLEISRPSYISLEQGKREISLSEAKKLSDLFGISLQELETGVIPMYDKYKEMILAFIRAAGSSRDGKLPKTKLAKLLYLADFAWFYDHFQSMSGMQYRRLQYGPVPDIYFRAIDELEQEGCIAIDRSKDDMILIGENRGSQRQNLTELSKSEQKLIEDIAKKWKEKKTQEIVNFTHNQLPYKLCVPDEVIPYELITQEDPEYVY